MKLLNKSIRSYLIYSGIVLLIAIPVFYFAIQQIVAEDVDESLVAQKQQILTKLEKLVPANAVTFLETFEPGIRLHPLSAFYPHDTLYTARSYDSISKENIPYRILESNINVGGTAYLIQLKSSMLDSEDLIESIVMVVVVLILLIAAGLLIINRMISKKIWRPFYRTLDKLRNYRIEENQPVQFEKTGIVEFTDLNNTITALTQRSQQVYQSQKEFTENASHEMQTPLAVFQGKLELLMQTTPLNSEQAELISGLADASQRLNRLNKNLLLLTRIENNLFPEKESISIREIIEKLLDQYHFQLKKKNIALSFDYTGEDHIIANRTLIEILFSNLLSNAIRYNNDNGTICLQLKEKVFTIANTGLDTPLDSYKIFSRFHKASTDLQSIGLGLAIAEKISALYHLELAYTYSKNKHIFSFRF
jgi:signal transduction histidine kinase